MGSYLTAPSPDSFFPKIFNLHIFTIFFLLNMTQMRANIQKATSHIVSVRFELNFISMLIMGNMNIDYYSFGDLPKIKKKLWHFEFSYRFIFCSLWIFIQDHMGLDISKLYPPTVFVQPQPNILRALAIMVEWVSRGVSELGLFNVASWQPCRVLWATDREPGNEMKDESAPNWNTPVFEPGTQWSEVECSTARASAPRYCDLKTFGRNLWGT